jgi:hypothetical protein
MDLGTPPEPGGEIFRSLMNIELQEFKFDVFK